MVSDFYISPATAPAAGSGASGAEMRPDRPGFLQEGHSLLLVLSAGVDVELRSCLDGGVPGQFCHSGQGGAALDQPTGESKKRGTKKRGPGSQGLLVVAVSCFCVYPSS